MPRAKRAYHSGDEPVPGYRLISFLGRGNFGEVWKASAPGGMEVALKIIDLSARGGMKEFGALQRMKHIHHPNLVPVFASWLITEDGQTITDFPGEVDAAALKGSSPDAIAQLAGVGGQKTSRLTDLVIAMGLGVASLASRLEDCLNEGKAGIPHEELLDYMEGAARGIDYLNQPVHDLGEGPDSIIHGDIKPHNILVVGNAVQVCDFGLARAVESLRRTSTGTGTFAYAAPELLEGMPNRSSDQYCLAVSYVELCTGDLPFNETNPLKVVEMHRRGELDFSRLGVRESEVVKRATAVDPKLRWPSCTAMVRALQRACEADQVTSSAELQTGAVSTRTSTGLTSDSARLPKGTARPPSLRRHDTSQTPAVHSVVETVASGTLPKLRPRPLPRSKRRIATWALAALLLIAGGVGAYYSLLRLSSDRQIEECIRADRIAEAFRIADGRESLVSCACTCLEARICDLAKNGKYGAADDDLKNAPVPAKQLAEWRGLIKEKWEARVDSRKKAADFVGVVAELSIAATTFPDDAKRELAAVPPAWSGKIKDIAAANGFRAANREWQTVPKDLKDSPRASWIIALLSMRRAWSKEIGECGGNDHFRDAIALLKEGDPAWSTDAAGKQMVDSLLSQWSARIFKRLVSPDDFDKAFAVYQEIEPPWRQESVLQSLVGKWTYRIGELAGRGRNHDYPGAWAMFAVAPACCVSDYQRSEAQKRIVDRWKESVRALADEDKYAEACNLWKELPDTAAIHRDREELLGGLKSDWSKKVLSAAEEKEGGFTKAYPLWQKADASWTAEKDRLTDDLKKALKAEFDRLVDAEQYKMALDLYERRAPPTFRSLSLDDSHTKLFDKLLASAKQDGAEDAKLTLRSFLAEHYPERSGEIDAAFKAVRPGPTFAAAFDSLKNKIDGVSKSADGRGLEDAKTFLVLADSAANADQKAMLDPWRTIVTLYDRATPADRLATEVAEAGKLLKSPELVRRRPTMVDNNALCKALGALASRPTCDGPLMDNAMATLQKAHNDPGLSGNIDRKVAAEALERLWPKRIEIALKEKSDALQDRFEKDSKWLEKTHRIHLMVGLAAVWRDEFLLERHRISDLGTPPEIPDNFKAYGHYVAALRERLSQPDPDWLKIAKSLDNMFAAGLTAEISEVADRNHNVVDMAAEAAAKIRQNPAAADLLSRQFYDPDQADLWCRLLKNVDSMPAVNGGKRQTTEGAAVSLALAAMSIKPPDLKRARSKLEPVVAQLIDKKPRPDATSIKTENVIPALHAYLCSRLQGQSEAGPGQLEEKDKQQLIRACTCLCNKLHESLRNEALNRKDAAAFYKDVLCPIRKLADEAADGDHEFYASMGHYIWDQRAEVYADFDVNTLVAQLFSAAIGRLPKESKENVLAGYYLARGQAMLAGAGDSGDLKPAIDDAQKAIDNKPALPDLCVAHGLKCQAYLQQAQRPGSTPAQQLIDLSESIAAGETAVKTEEAWSGNDESFASVLKLLSTAHIWRANNRVWRENNAGAKAVQDLHEAVRIADKVKKFKKLGNAFYVQLGAAYEDLAWLVKKDPDENYVAAVQAFKQAIPGAEAHLGIGRCYYRSVAASGRSPSIWAKQINEKNVTASRMMEKCREECGKEAAAAKDESTNMAEAYKFTALAYDYEGLFENQDANYQDADENYARARDHAPKGESMYLELWAKHPLSDLRNPKRSAAARDKIRISRYQWAEVRRKDKVLLNREGGSELATWLISTRRMDEGDVWLRDAWLKEDKGTSKATPLGNALGCYELAVRAMGVPGDDVKRATLVMRARAEKLLYDELNKAKGAAALDCLRGSIKDYKDAIGPSPHGLEAAQWCREAFFRVWDELMDIQTAGRTPDKEDFDHIAFSLPWLRFYLSNLGTNENLSTQEQQQAKDILITGTGFFANLAADPQQRKQNAVRSIDCLTALLGEPKLERLPGLAADKHLLEAVKRLAELLGDERMQTLLEKDRNDRLEILNSARQKADAL